MTIKCTLIACAIVAATATGVHAQQAGAAPVDPLTQGQNMFGAIVGNAFRAPNQIAAATIPGATSLEQPLGGALRTSLQIPGAAFAALFLPFDTDPAAASPSPAPIAHPPHRRHAKSLHHHEPA